MTEPTNKELDAVIKHYRTRIYPQDMQPHFERAIMRAVLAKWGAQPTTSSAAEFALQALVAAGHVSQELVDRALALPGAPQPAHSGEPVAFIHWPINGHPRLAWYSQKALNDAILKTYEGHQPDVKLYTAPQPVERELLTDEQIHAIYDEVARRGPYSVAVTRRNVVRAIEAAHGTKGGQHGADT